MSIEGRKNLCDYFFLPSCLVLLRPTSFTSNLRHLPKWPNFTLLSSSDEHFLGKCFSWFVKEITKKRASLGELICLKSDTKKILETVWMTDRTKTKPKHRYWSNSFDLDDIERLYRILLISVPNIVTYKHRKWRKFLVLLNLKEVS